MAYKDAPYFFDYWSSQPGPVNPAGQVFYVGASGWTAASPEAKSVSDGNNGLSPEHPFSTIQAGLDACQSGRGDVVALLPGSYTITAVLTMTKSDVTLCSARPVARQQYSPVIITAAAAYNANVISVDADRCKIVGIGFECGFTTVTANQEVIQLNSTNTTTDIYGTQIINCYFDHSRAAGAATTTDSDLDCIRVGLDANDAAIDTLIRGCVIYNCDQNAIVIVDGSVRSTVADCLIYDNGTILTMSGVTVGALNCVVNDNVFSISTTDSGPAHAGGGACIYNYKAAAQMRAHNNYMWARGADTNGIFSIATATQFTTRNFVVGAANTNDVDYTTAQTSPSADIVWAVTTATNPAKAALYAPTEDGA